MTLVEEANLATMTSLWNISTVNPALTCSYTSPYFTTFTYNFYNKLVGDDYMWRTVPVLTPHYQLSIRFAIAYIGVWGTNNDYIHMHLDDTIQTRDVNLSFNCALTTGGTDAICTNHVLSGSSTNAYNGVDCMQTYDFTYNHNTTSMLINLTYPNFERDPTIKFWCLFDIIIVATNCHANCATCYGALNTECFSCRSGFYYFENNTCLAGCAAGLFLLVNQLNTTTGECLASCPQGYYHSGTNCLACETGCLSCNDANVCLAWSAVEEESLWRKFLVVWVIIIILGVFLIFAIVWKVAFSQKAVNNEQMKMIPDDNRNRKGSYEEKATIQETMPPEPFNFHIEEIDYKDNIEVDVNPRVRKRVQVDRTRSVLD